MPTIEVILCLWLPEALQTDNDNGYGENNNGDGKSEDDSDNVDS